MRRSLLPSHSYPIFRFYASPPTALIYYSEITRTTNLWIIVFSWPPAFSLELLKSQTGLGYTHKLKIKYKKNRPYMKMSWVIFIKLIRKIFVGQCKPNIYESVFIKTLTLYLTFYALHLRYDLSSASRQ